MSDDLDSILSDDSSAADGFLSQFDDPVDREVAQELLKNFNGTEQEQIVKAISEAKKDIDPDTSPLIKKTLMLGSANGYLSEIETTKDFPFFLTGFYISSYQDNIKVHAYGIVTLTEDGKKKPYPAKIFFSNLKEENMKIFHEAELRTEYRVFCTFNDKTIDFSEGKMILPENDKGKKFAPSKLRPIQLYGTDITKFDNQTDKPDLSLIKIAKELYGVNLNVSIEHGEKVAGLSKVETGTIQGKEQTWNNRDDLKLLLIHPTKDPEPLFGDNNRSTFDAITYKGNESITVECMNHKDITQFNKKDYDLIAFCVIKRNNNSKYSDFKIEMVAAQPILRTKVEKLLQ